MANEDKKTVQEARKANKLSFWALILSLLACVATIILAFETHHTTKILENEYARDSPTIRLKGVLYKTNGKTHERTQVRTTLPQWTGENAPYAAVPAKEQGTPLEYSFKILITNTGDRVAYVDELNPTLGVYPGKCLEFGPELFPSPWHPPDPSPEVLEDSERRSFCEGEFSAEDFLCAISGENPEPCDLPFAILPGQVHTVTLDLTRYLAGIDAPYCGPDDVPGEGYLVVAVSISDGAWDKVSEPIDGVVAGRPANVGNAVSMQLVNRQISCSSPSSGETAPPLFDIPVAPSRNS